jgi:hypothetical protein
MGDLCRICAGSGNLVRFAPLSFWQCLYCGGSGVRVQYGPAFFKDRTQ